jgi:predicted ABC-type ATPase
VIAGCNGTGKTKASYIILTEILNCDEFVNADEIARGFLRSIQILLEFKLTISCYKGLIYCLIKEGTLYLKPHWQQKDV